MIPQRTLDALDRYVNEGTPTGDFLYAVLTNNLMDSFARADEGNRAALFEICQYVYNELPFSCHRSKEKVEAWIKRKRNHIIIKIGDIVEVDKSKVDENFYNLSCIINTSPITGEVVALERDESNQLIARVKWTKGHLTQLWHVGLLKIKGKL